MILARNGGFLLMAIILAAVLAASEVWAPTITIDSFAATRTSGVTAVELLRLQVD